MKKINIILIAILFGGFVIVQFADANIASWDDSFDSYNNGDIALQGTWVTSSDVSAEVTQNRSYNGTKSLTLDPIETGIVIGKKSVTDLYGNSNIYWRAYVMMIDTGTSDDSDLYLEIEPPPSGTNESNGCKIRFQGDNDGNSVELANGNGIVVIGSSTENVWMQIDMHLNNSASNCRAQLNGAGWSNTLNITTVTSTSYFQIWKQNTGTNRYFYIDNLLVSTSSISEGVLGNTSFVTFPNGNFINGTSTDYMLRINYYNASTSSGYIHVTGVQTAGNITRGSYSFTKNIGGGEAGSDYYTLSNLNSSSTWTFNAYLKLDPDNYSEAAATSITGTFAAGEDPNQIRISLTGSYGLGTHVSSTCNYGDAFFSAQEIACETMELIKWAVYPSDTSLQTLQNAVKSWNVIFPFNIVFDTYDTIEDKLAVQTPISASSTLIYNGQVIVDFASGSMAGQFGTTIKNQIFTFQKYVFYFGLGIMIIATILLL